MKIPFLKTSRLTLRPYQRSDFEEFASLNADEAVRRHVGGPLTREHASRLFDTFMAADCLPGNEVWAVTSKDAGEYIGHCWFTQKRADWPEMGFLVATKYWRQGFGSEIAQRLVDYARTEAGYPRIIATVDCDHIPSIRVLERVGMRRERIAQDDEGEHFVYVFEEE